VNIANVGNVWNGTKFLSKILSYLAHVISCIALDLVRVGSAGRDPT